MHENRETSEASRLNQSRDRSEKALRRTADRQVSEESDCAIVPVNLSNKEEQSSAEMGEGRARAKENIGPSNTSPTQSGERVSQGRGGVRSGRVFFNNAQLYLAGCNHVAEQFEPFGTFEDTGYRHRLDLDSPFGGLVSPASNRNVDAPVTDGAKGL
jgi:hypothetical protein